MIIDKARLATSAVAVLLWLTVAAAGAQKPDGAAPDASGFADRIDVELVNVDVWVSDRRGNPVTGLEAEDFEILHDGRPVPATHFTEVLGSTAGGPAEKSFRADPSVAPAPTHIVVYFDQAHLHPRGYPALIRGLEEFLATGDVDPERVLFLRQDRGLFVAAPFGSSQKELERTLARLAEEAPSALLLETETNQALEAIRTAWEQSQDVAGSAAGGLAAIPDTVGGESPGIPGTGGGGGPRAVVGGGGSEAGPDACGMFLNQIQPILDSFSRWKSQRSAVTLSNLADAASFVAGLPGVKFLLYLGDGLDVQPGAALATYASGLCPAGSIELLSNTLNEQLSASFLELTRHANANRVTIYSLQTTGLRTPGLASASAGQEARGGGLRSRASYDSSQRFDEREGLSLIAEQTGGRAIFDRNELGPAMIQIARDLQSYYSLAYRPPAGEGEGREHRIEIRLKDGSLSARYRRGYLEKNDDQWLTERIEGALNLGITDNPLGVRLGAGDVRPGDAPSGGERTFRLPLHVMVPIERIVFVPRDGGQVAEITVRAIARNLASGAVATRQQSYRIRGVPGAEGYADLVLELELGEGVQLTAVGVRDHASREASFVSTTVDLGPGG